MHLCQFLFLITVGQSCRLGRSKKKSQLSDCTVSFYHYGSCPSRLILTGESSPNMIAQCHFSSEFFTCFCGSNANCADQDDISAIKRTLREARRFVEQQKQNSSASTQLWNSQIDCIWNALDVAEEGGFFAQYMAAVIILSLLTVLLLGALAAAIYFLVTMKKPKDTTKSKTNSKEDEEKSKKGSKEKEKGKGGKGGKETKGKDKKGSKKPSNNKSSREKTEDSHSDKKRSGYIEKKSGLKASEYV